MYKIYEILPINTDINKMDPIAKAHGFISPANSCTPTVETLLVILAKMKSSNEKTIVIIPEKNIEINI